jgi:hypothetical protein
MDHFAEGLPEEYLLALFLIHEWAKGKGSQWHEFLQHVRHSDWPQLATPMWTCAFPNASKEVHDIIFFREKSFYSNTRDRDRHFSLRPRHWLAFAARDRIELFLFACTHPLQRRRAASPWQPMGCRGRVRDPR